MSAENHHRAELLRTLRGRVAWAAELGYFAVDREHYAGLLAALAPAVAGRAALAAAPPGAAPAEFARREALRRDTPPPAAAPVNWMAPAARKPRQSTLFAGSTDTMVDQLAVAQPVGGASAEKAGRDESAGVVQGELDALRNEIGADCSRCGLCQQRTQVVFGVGNPKARLLFAGEGPGFDEDRRGEPFVGRAGQLLDKIIAAIGLTRPDVYICNVVKCRPPGNRTPLPDEMDTCGSFLLRQIEMIRPEVIVALGNTPAQYLLKQKTPMSQWRGRFFPFHGAKLLPTYHPAYLLRNPAAKRVVWDDMQKVMAELGLSRPPAQG